MLHLICGSLSHARLESSSISCGGRSSGLANHPYCIPRQLAFKFYSTKPKRPLERAAAPADENLRLASIWSANSPFAVSTGKTTLLDLLAGRKTQGEASGRILFAGQKPSRPFLKRFTGE